jgi:hypothetical protein
MSISVACPSCGAALKAAEKFIGRKVSCPKCGVRLVIPSPLAGLPREPAPQTPADPDAADLEEVVPVEPIPRGPNRGRDAKPSPHGRNVEEGPAEVPTRRPPKHPGGIPCVVWLLGGLGILFALCCGGFITLATMSSSSVSRMLTEADAKYAQGRRDEAIPTYKAFFSSCPNKGEILKRIVEYELARGNTAEAKEWIAKGLNAGIAVTYDTDAAKALVEKVKKEKEEGAHAGINRENYNKIRDGMTYEEVKALLGPGEENASGGGVNVMSWKRGFSVITITFENGRVAAKAQVGL